MQRSRITALVVLAAAISPTPAQDHEYRELELPGGGTLEYAVQLPADYDARKTWPVLLAMPPGGQTKAMVEAGFRRYWGAQARERGWVVVSPVAPDGVRFFRGSERHVPQLLRRLRIDFRIERGRFHLAGASNGGRSAFRLATAQPFEFRSLVVLPGYPVSDADRAGLAGLRDMVVRMFVGGEDGNWTEQTEATRAQLVKLGVDVEAKVLPGEGHVPPSLDGEVVLELLEELRGQRRPESPVRAAIEFALDDFHDAAAKADAERYFGAFAPEGVFLGTDATERWTVAQFREWAGFAFARESAWIFAPVSRQVELSPDGDVAWFDEVLGSVSYGECRGTGVLRQIDGRWRVAHYNLTVPVPNALLGAVVEMIRSGAVPPSAAAETKTTTVYVVRHAEKQKGDDPSLTETGRARAAALRRLLGSTRVAAVFASQFRRTQETVAPVATGNGVEVTVVDAAAPGDLARAVRDEHRGRTVVVAGHSNTVPAILRALGAETDLKIADSDYDNLFVVTIHATGEVALAHLHYGDG